MGYRIMIERKYVCGYSQRRLAKMVGEDVETIRMLEDGRLRNPQPDLMFPCFPPDILAPHKINTMLS